MNKPEFLHILREKLSILDEKELEDILNEYEQHIDMKAAGAMTEEAAIADFGDIDVLTADILEAYHVRSDFALKKSKQKENRTTERIGDSIWNVWKSVTASCKKGWQHLLDAFRKAGHYMEKNIEKCGTAIYTIFRIRKKPVSKPVLAVETEKETVGGKKLLPSFGRKHEEKQEKMEKKNRITLFTVMGAIFRGLAGAAVWCAKAVWNVFCVCLVIMIGLLAFACIFILGTLMILLMTGYPLWGIALAFLGLTMCACSAAAFFFTLIIRHKKQTPKPDEKEEKEPEREGEIANA